MVASAPKSFPWPKKNRTEPSDQIIELLFWEKVKMYKNCTFDREGRVRARTWSRKVRFALTKIGSREERANADKKKP